MTSLGNLERVLPDAFDTNLLEYPSSSSEMPGAGHLTAEEGLRAFMQDRKERSAKIHEQLESIINNPQTSEVKSRNHFIYVSLIGIHSTLKV